MNLDVAFFFACLALVVGHRLWESMYYVTSFSKLSMTHSNATYSSAIKNISHEGPGRGEWMVPSVEHKSRQNVGSVLPHAEGSETTELLRR